MLKAKSLEIISEKNMENLLEIKDLKVYFETEQGLSRALENGCLNINKGETLGLVGESGCGKTVTALSILKLISSPPAKLISGKILFKKENILEFSEAQMRNIRGKVIAMVFQEPMVALNPLFTIGYQIAESMKRHLTLSKTQIREKTIELLAEVEMPSPKEQVDNFPHQLSGGMRQRAMIAMALACNPELLIADEPTTALDVTIQAQILSLFSKLKHKFGISILLITHDLAVVSEIADRVTVMYAGVSVEFCSKEELFNNPLHPYTQGLLKSIPLLQSGGREQRLSVIPGNVPNPISRPSGCPFHPRCSRVITKCKTDTPFFLEKISGHWTSCWKV